MHDRPLVPGWVPFALAGLLALIAVAAFPDAVPTLPRSTDATPTVAVTREATP